MRLSKQHCRFLVAIPVLVLCACDRLAPQEAADAKFELRQDDKGRLIRLNKVTGEIAVIRDGKPVPIAKSDAESPSSRPSSNVPSPPAPSFSRAVNSRSPATNSGSPGMTRSVAPLVERVTAVGEAPAPEPGASA